MTEAGRLRTNPFLRAAVVFLAAYFAVLVLWIPVKDYYGRGVTFLASKIVAGVKSAVFEGLTLDRGVILATFEPYPRKTGVVVDIPVKTSSYAFNIPLTLGIIAALIGFIRNRWRAVAEAAAFLFLIHLLFVGTLETLQLTEAFMNYGVEGTSAPRLALSQFLWGCTDNMVIRFEPFLIGFYVFLRFRDRDR
jgi:hypothetical protein